MSCSNFKHLKFFNICVKGHWIFEHGKFTTMLHKTTFSSMIWNKHNTYNTQNIIYYYFY